jgi:prepilin-type N-terminal cleavage/methylation domain-containing protein
MTNSRRKNEDGFSLTELVVVVGIIALVSAFSLPAIASYYRNYQVNGAARNVASEINTARMKAISRNVNQGVTFQVIDNNSYRYIVEDENPDLMGTLYDLPPNVRFQTALAADGGFRFNRLGMVCRAGSSATCPALPAVTCSAAEASRCAQSPGNYVLWDTANARYRITIVHAMTGVTRNIDVAFGGRVLAQ